MENIVAQVFIWRKPENFERSSVKSIQSIFGTEPHKALSILKNAVNGILRQSVINVEMTKRIARIG
jgi:hypothetical protein